MSRAQIVKTPREISACCERVEIRWTARGDRRRL
jgi:hypothetical protein